MDAAEWAEEMVVVKASSLPPPMEGMMSSSSSITILPPQTMERKTRIPHKEQKQPFNCPRCKSPNTKFCYYNNYSLTQPRYFCKSCRRYWTEGGSLRNVPVGGGSRKNKRSASSSSSASSNISSSSLHPPSINADPPNATKLSSDLSLAFPASSSSLHNPDLANTGDYHHHQQQHQYMAIQNMNICNSTSNSRNRITNMNPFNSMPMLHENSSAVGYPTAAPASGFGLQASFTPESTTLTFPTVDGGDINGASVFPFEDLRMQASSINPNNQFDENGGKAGRGGGGGEHSSGFWNGVIGNGAPTW